MDRLLPPLTVLISAASLIGAVWMAVSHALLAHAVPSKKPPNRKSARPPENLHIAAIQRIVGKHHNQSAHAPSNRALCT